MQGLIGGHVQRLLGVVIKPSDGEAFCWGVLHGSRWRDVSLVLIPPFIACRKLAMRPFFGLKRGFDHGKSVMVWGAIFVFPPRAPAIQSSCYLIESVLSCGGDSPDSPAWAELHKPMSLSLLCSLFALAPIV